MCSKRAPTCAPIAFPVAAKRFRVLREPECGFLEKVAEALTATRKEPHSRNTLWVVKADKVES